MEEWMGTDGRVRGTEWKSEWRSGKVRGSKGTSGRVEGKNKIMIMKE